MRRASAFIIVFMLTAVMLLPLAARNGAAQGFATNTPQPPPPPTRTPLPLPPMAVATNTPPPVITTPAAPVGRYALRQWRENDLLAALEMAVRRLRPGDAEGERAVALVQYELSRRFPAAPRDLDRRRALVETLLAAPRGSVDARAIVRPYIAALLAAEDARPGGAFSADGFQVELLPANFDGAPPLDALVYVRYLDDPLAAPRYVDYILARADAAGRLTLLDSDPPMPAAPLNNLTSVQLLGIGDYNGDSLDEAAITAAVAGDVNRRLYFYGLRGGQAVSLVEPGREIAYGTLDSSPAGAVSVLEHRVESADWNCLSQRPVTWRWQQNFWRPQPTSAGYTLQPTTACRFYDSGPYYDLPTGDAIIRLDAIIALVPPEDTAAIAQAQVIKAMLYALEGQPEIAAAQMRAARSADPSVTAQADAFFAAAAQPGARPIHLCAALAQVSAAACDVDLVLARLFDDAPLRRDRPVVEQLAERGIVVEEARTLAQVGRANREVVRLDLAGERWWAFAPLNPDVYTAERISPPPGAAAPAPEPTPPAVIEVAPAVYTALLQDNNPARALSVLETTLSRSPGATLSPEAAYLRAYSYDLLADRTRARDSYYALWQSAPRTVWGQLAAAHLEQR